jgi:hypothetical protein
MTAANLAVALVKVIGVEAATPVIRAALAGPVEDQRPLLEDAYETALCFVMAASEVPMAKAKRVPFLLIDDHKD